MDRFSLSRKAKAALFLAWHVAGPGSRVHGGQGSPEKLLLQRVRFRVPF
jgi:hypothetical protein